MPIAPGMFARSKPFESLVARARVVLLDSTGTRRTVTVRCRVDTGSDLTILPLWVATDVNIQPRLTLTITTISGAPLILPAEPNLTLEIEGTPISGRRVAFSGAAGFVPVVGLHDLLTAFDFGFSYGPPGSWQFD